jgi:hypothetical protein
MTRNFSILKRRDINITYQPSPSLGIHKIKSFWVHELGAINPIHQGLF